MNPRERGFLLLTSRLGDPARHVLTVKQMAALARKVTGMDAPEENRELILRDLTQLGYPEDMARRILDLLSQGELLQNYLRRGEAQGCIPLTRVSEGYPYPVRQRLGLESPGCLWAKGDLSLLEEPCIALVGSRELHVAAGMFAQAAGREAAKQGFVLVSGNARGADKIAQESCLAAGGSVISVVADPLAQHSTRQRVLYLSEDGFDAPFSPQRALSRNRIIHTLGQLTFVAQADLNKGGTWSGTAMNLRQGWSPVLCFDDGSKAAAALKDLGANLIQTPQLSSISALIQMQHDR